MFPRWTPRCHNVLSGRSWLVILLFLFSWDFLGISLSTWFFFFLRRRYFAGTNTRVGEAKARPEENLSLNQRWFDFSICLCHFMLEVLLEDECLSEFEIFVFKFIERFVHRILSY